MIPFNYSKSCFLYDIAFHGEDNIYEDNIRIHTI